MKILSFAQVLIMSALLFFVNSSYSQEGVNYPFNGLYFQEIEIESEALSSIEGQIGEGAKCFRVYACMQDPFWELQLMFGDVNAPWAISFDGDLYQDVFGGAMAMNINPALIDVFPSLQYDSWFTIGREDNSSQVFYATSELDPLAVFELGTGFLENTVVGSALTGDWLPPNSQGLPLLDNSVLLGQFTTSASFSMTFNFQFRKLNPDGTVFLPIELSQVYGAELEVNYAEAGSSCPMSFQLGCTDSQACNYDPDHTHEDGSCFETCIGDSDCNGYISASDLLGFLSHYGCSGDDCGIGGPIPDFDGDGTVFTSDLLSFLGVFGTVCP
jgi:hypothetical protein